MIALVLGGAACVHDDAQRALALFEPDAVAAVNNIGIEWPGRLDYWFTLHPRRTAKWAGIETSVKKRLDAGLNRPQVWSHKPGPSIDRHTADWGGSSALLAVRGLRQEGFGRIVLAGVPMDGSAHFNSDGRGWTTFMNFRNGWNRQAKEIRPFVRSMSGWTMEQFGAPSAQWLLGETDHTQEEASGSQGSSGKSRRRR